MRTPAAHAVTRNAGPAKIVIENGFVLTLDKAGTVVPNGRVEIDDDRITFVGPAAARDTSAAEPTTVIDATGKVVMPGLINGHTHLCMTFARSICYELNLLDWLRTVQFPLMDAMDDTAYYLAQLVGYIENLKNGNTTVVDNACTSHKQGASAEAVNVRAAVETGVRTFLALCAADQNHYEHGMQTPEDIVARCRDAIQAYHNGHDGRVKTLIGPELPWVCSERMFREIVELGETFDIGYHMHANENPDWNALGEKAHGVPTNLGVFRKYGCLGPKTTVAAMRVISEDDIRLLAETGASLIHDPMATLNRGWGLPDIPRVQAAGVRVGLGSNALGQDLFEAMRVAGWLARTMSGGGVDGQPVADALPLEVALKMATITNAEALGIGAEVGSLEAGKKADVITVNVGKVRQAPCLNVLSAVALSAWGGDVEEVVANGQLLVRGGKLTHLDEEAIVREATERALHCAKKAQLDGRLLPLR